VEDGEMERIDKAFDLTIIHPVSEQDVIDLIVTAVEGGINYWCPAIKIKVGVCSDFTTRSERLADVILKGSTLLLAVDEDETGNEEDFHWHELDKAKLQVGFDKFFARAHDKVRLDPGDWDVEVADGIIQMSIFGDIVYA
jgi:hypothetical protein